MGTRFDPSSWDEELRSEIGEAPVNGAQIHYEVAGTGHPLVLVHAGVADSRMWDEQFAAFAIHFRTVRYDLRGFGQTRAPAGEFAHYEDLLGLLRHLGIARAHVVGLSLGGSAALELALAYPEAVTALVLAATSPSGFARSEETRQGWAEGEAAIDRGDVDRAIEIDLEMWVDGPRRRPTDVEPEVRRRMRELVAATYAVPGEIGPERHLEPRAITRLGELGAPTLIVVGDQDMPEMLPAADLMAREIPNARKVVIPGAAHMLNVEYPDTFNQAVLDFLRA